MSKKIPYELYDLIPSQETMHLMVKYSFKKQIVQIPCSFTAEAEINYDLMQKAFEIEIERNDSLRNRFTVVDKELKQYFIPPFKMTVPKKFFRSSEEQQAFFDKDAKTPVKFKDCIPFRVYFFKTLGVGGGIYINVSHLAMDALGMVGCLFDTLRIYFALKKGEPIPAPLDSYEEYIQQEFLKLKDEKKQAKHAKFYEEYWDKDKEPFYAGVHGPEFLEKARKKQKNPNLRVPAAYNPLFSSCKQLTLHIDPETSKNIFEYCKANSIAPESLFMFALRTHCSAINYRTDDVFMMVTCSKRATNKEKNMSGCLVQPIQVRTIISEDKTFAEALKEYTRVRTSLYRHLDYPYIKARDMSRDVYGYNLIQGPACMMFTWLPLPIDRDMGFKYSFQIHDLGAYFTPLYTICSPDPTDKGINMTYLYRHKLSTQSQIEKLHENALKTIVAGLENSDITVGELLDNCGK